MISDTLKIICSKFGLIISGDKKVTDIFKYPNQAKIVLFEL